LKRWYSKYLDVAEKLPYAKIIRTDGSPKDINLEIQSYLKDL